MKLAFPLALAAMLAAPVAARADEALATFLERRVPQELANDGILLARRDLTLKVEQVGDKLLVSLVDGVTGRTSASTKIDAVPPDREAAVATVTHVAAELVAQVTGRPAPEPPPPPPPAPPAPLPPPTDPRAEITYQKEAIRFTADYDILVGKNSATVVRRWIAYRGELEERLEPTDFYKTLARPDLAEAYEQRQNYMVAGFVGSGLLLVAGATLFIKGTHDGASCIDVRLAGANGCDPEVEGRTSRQLGLGLAIGATIPAIIGMYYYRNPHPISESEAKRLAGEYNTGVRKRLGLPVAKRATPRLHDVRVAPYFGGDDGGLAVAARF